ncbi:MAG: hypothetical protein V4649_17480 [Bacteroidota bacterium]
MKRVLCTLAILISGCFSPLFALSTTDELLALVKMMSGNATQKQMIDKLGQPVKIQERSRRTAWYYSPANGNLKLVWDKRENQLEVLNFTAANAKKDTFDETISGKLQSGKTDLTQAVKLLGFPKEMTIKETRQELHYIYHNSVLRLFFRDNVLVDFALIGTKTD